MSNYLQCLSRDDNNDDDVEAQSHDHPKHSHSRAYFSAEEELTLCRRASKIHMIMILDPVQIVKTRMKFEGFNPVEFFEAERKKTNSRWRFHMLTVMTAFLPIVFACMNSGGCPPLPGDEDVGPWPVVKAATDFYSNVTSRIPYFNTAVNFATESDPVQDMFVVDMDAQAEEVHGAVSDGVARGVTRGKETGGAMQDGAERLGGAVADHFIEVEETAEKHCAVLTFIAKHRCILCMVTWVAPLILTALLGLWTSLAHWLHGDKGESQTDSLWLSVKRAVFFPLLYFWWTWMDYQMPGVKYANSAVDDAIYPFCYSPPSMYMCNAYLCLWFELLSIGWFTGTFTTSIVTAYAVGGVFIKLAQYLLTSTDATRNETVARIRNWMPKQGVKVFGKDTVLDKIQKVSDTGLRQISLNTSDFLQLKQLKVQHVAPPAAPHREKGIMGRIGGDGHPDSVAIINSVLRLPDKGGKVELIELRPGLRPMLAGGAA